MYGAVQVTKADGYTITRWPDGRELVAAHAAQPGQEQTAAEIGVSVEEMNREHDVWHTKVCQCIGLPSSPALEAAVQGKGDSEIYGIEEAAVLAVQKLAAAYGRHST
jgi:hypothetical protein